MNKKKFVGLIIIILIFFSAATVIIITLLKRDEKEIVISPDGTEIKVQKPIKGPDVGEGGNDFDNTFRSLTISPTDPNIVYIGNEGNGIFRSLDGGKTWEWLRRGLKHEGNHYPEVYAIAIDENNESIILAATTNGPSPIDSDEYTMPITAGIYRSEDKGDTWTQFLSGLPNSAITSLIQYPGRADTFVIGLDGLESSRDNYRHLEVHGGIYISYDGGKSWTALPIPQEGIQNRYAKLQVRGKSDPVVYTAGIRWKKTKGTFQSRPDDEGSIGLLRGDNEGQTWTRINPGDAFVLYFDVSADGNTIYAGDLDEYVLHISDDRGASWKTIQSRGTGALKISPNNKNKVLFSNGNELYLTEDKFKTDKKVLTLERGVNDIEYFKKNPDIIYVSGGGLEVYKSTDGGETFKKMVNLREFIDSYE